MQARRYKSPALSQLHHRHWWAHVQTCHQVTEPDERPLRLSALCTRIASHRNCKAYHKTCCQPNMAGYSRRASCPMSNRQSKKLFRPQCQTDPSIVLVEADLINGCLCCTGFLVTSIFQGTTGASGTSTMLFMRYLGSPCHLVCKYCTSILCHTTRPPEYLVLQDLPHHPIAAWGQGRGGRGPRARSPSPRALQAKIAPRLCKCIF